MDTSAFAKLLLREDGSAGVAALWNAADSVSSSRILYVEARAAVAAARRTGRICPRTTAHVRRQLETLAETLDLVELLPELVRAAGDVAERYALRANDAVHLASAVALADPDLVIASSDAELRRAAQSSGFAVAP